MENAINSIPSIISEAAKSYLGIMALLIVSLSILAYIFFKNARPKTRIGVFVLLFIGVAAFGVAMFRNSEQPPGNQQNGDETSTDKPTDIDPKKLSACIVKKKKSFKPTRRQETLTLGLHASRGKWIACKTVKTKGKKTGKGPGINEDFDGKPECTVESAKLRDRAKILFCAQVEGKPVLQASVAGIGCEQENSATFVMVQKYKSIISQDDRDRYLRECVSELQRQ